MQPSLLDQVRASGELRVVTRNSPITYFIGQAGPKGRTTIWCAALPITWA
ncbi:MAG: hypothetical protein R3F24_07950 [Gammaproteobacteria bacterium]